MHNAKSTDISAKNGVAGGRYVKCEVLSLEETVITRITVRHNTHKCI